jgi:glycosyltransferase involved in cell wall biosynthesis
MELPKISVITPSFNQGSYIEETILSVLSQDYPSLEYIIIDGKSTDKSVEVIQKYQHRLAYWVSEPDSGQSEAINKGLKRATGNIITWLCSDDIYLPGALHTIAKAFTDNPDAGLIHGKTILFDEKGKETIRGAVEKDLELKYFSIIPFPQPSSFFSRNSLNKTNLLDESLHFAMDYDLLIRIALEFKIYKIDDILSKYRMHNLSKTVSQQSGFANEWMVVFSRFLYSVSGGEKFLEQIKEAGFIHDDGRRYLVRKNFPADNIRLICCYFLLYQLIIYYDQLNREKCKTLLSLIKKIDEKFYIENQVQLTKRRLNMLPDFLIRALRRIIRK